MKYMTPDLLARFRSPDDDVADAADSEWERQAKAYTQHLREIRKDLTGGVRRLLRYNLHDAKVLTMAVDEVPHFSLFLELDEPGEPDGKKRLELRYRLVSSVKKSLSITRHEALIGDGKPLAWWLYDEIDMLQGEVPALTHSILLTGGYEIRLTFFGVSIRKLDFFSLPSHEAGEADPKIAGQWKSLRDAIGAP
jgi:hypothetical protein